MLDGVLDGLLALSHCQVITSLYSTSHSLAEGTDALLWPFQPRASVPSARRHQPASRQCMQVHPWHGIRCCTGWLQLLLPVTLLRHTVWVLVQSSAQPCAVP